MTTKMRPSGSQHLPCARVNRVTDQLVGENSVSAVVFTGVEYDAPGYPALMWNSSLAARLTAPLTGIYNCNGCANFATDNSSYKQLRLCVNGSGNVKVIMNNAYPSALQQHCTVLNCDIFMYAGDYLEMYAWHNKVGGLNLTGSAYALTMSMALVIPWSYSTEWGGA